MYSHSKQISAFFALLLATLVSVTSIVQAQAFVAIKEAGTVQTTDFGPVPKEILWKKDNQVMVLIPAGTYTIGRKPNLALEINENETPEVTVTVGSFFIDKTEVTNLQYTNQLSATGVGKPRSITNENLLDDSKPVVGISWFDALGYAKNLQKDLPTEAEWEIAARGKEAFLYPWGNFDQQGAARVRRSLVDGTVPVGTMKSDVSPFGVADMAGNVSEWVKDNYVRDYYSRVAGKTNPEITKNEESKTIRGGNFYGSAALGHLTYRNTVNPLYSREEVGFRTVFRLQPPPPEPTPTPAPPTPTPTPDPDDLAERMIQILQPYFDDPDKILPSEMVRFGAGGRTSQTVFYNQSPLRLTMAFVDPENELVYRYPTYVEPHSVILQKIPTASKLEMFATAENGVNSRITRLGQLNSASSPFIVIPASTFANTISADGNATTPETTTQLLQYYGKTYQPDWHIIQVYNGTSAPVEVMLDRIRPDGSVITPSSIVVDSNEVGIFNNFPGADFQISAKYLGATQPMNSQKVIFKTNNQQDRRFFSLFEDKLGKTYKVQLSVLPEIGIRKQEFKIPGEIRDSYVLD
ncbi:MAG: formylglycine-generating enzyme family protein [Sumerlaeia bacterium]